MNEHMIEQTIRKALVVHLRQQQGEHTAAQRDGKDAEADAAMQEILRARAVLEMIDHQRKEST
jgi:hypothetical protein